MNTAHTCYCSSDACYACDHGISSGYGVTYGRGDDITGFRLRSPDFEFVLTSQFSDQFRGLFCRFPKLKTSWNHSLEHSETRRRRRKCPFETTELSFRATRTRYSYRPAGTTSLEHSETRRRKCPFETTELSFRDDENPVLVPVNIQNSEQRIPVQES
jgi:hypothetical protein